MEDFNIEEILNAGENKEEGIKKDAFTAGKVVCSVVIGIFVSIFIFILTAVLYTNFIRFPAQEEIIYEQTGAYALSQYEDLVHSQKGLGKDDFLVKEVEYANSDKNKEAFIKKVVSTVHYRPNMINAKNVYGNDMIDRDSMKVSIMSSPVVEGEKVHLIYIDYSTITFDDTDALKELVKSYGLKKDDVNYSNILVSMFCEYISNLDEISVRSDYRVPYLKKVGDAYEVQAEEDMYLDQCLFSSKEFKYCEMRFTEAIGDIVTNGKLSESEEWVKWNELGDAEKDNTVQPLKYGKLTMSMNWCGAYYLQNEYYTTDENGVRVKNSLSPQLGDGSFESPASVGTSVLTGVLVKEKGKIIEKPIRVELVEYGVSGDAINWFQKKHTQNRGFILESEVQYCYFVLKVTNLSNEKLTINDNISLCDKSGNLSTRTGTIFGLTDKVTLKPDESGYIESWGRSTELYKKYVIWGADFDKKYDPVWFRVLAGDLEDKSEDKGVHIINKDRNSIKKKDSEKETTEAPTVQNTD